MNYQNLKMEIISNFDGCFKFIKNTFLTIYHLIFQSWSFDLIHSPVDIPLF